MIHPIAPQPPCETRGCALISLCAGFATLRLGVNIPHKLVSRKDAKAQRETAKHRMEQIFNLHFSIYNLRCLSCRHLAQPSVPMTTPLPEQIELHRDRMWRRDEDLRVESAVDAERFIEDVGFANTLTDTRRAGPSLYIAVCGRRDVSLPRNVQKDEETRLTWYLKDEVMRRGRVYYAKLAGGRSMFVAPRLISHFAAVWMPRRKDEPRSFVRPQPSVF